MESRLQELFQKYLSNQYSEQELDELLRYFELAEDEANLRENIRKEIHRLEVIPDQEERIDHLVAGVKQKLHDRIQPPEKPVKQLSPHKQYRWSYMKYYAAAAIIVALATALYLYRGDLFVNRKTNIVNQEILPGYNQATLTLADGTKVELDSAKRGIQIRDEDISYNDGTKIAAKTIVPDPLRSSGSTLRSENRNSSIVNSTMLTLSTPKGGQYQIILSDGTKVWLNAASTLKYPSRFSGDRREVSLEGEAYFEVNNNPSIGAMQDNRKSYLVNRKSNVPFVVKSRNQEILVLGTKFNVTAFNDEKETKTTLVEGKVQVKSQNLKLKTYNLQLLTPAQQAVVKGDSLTVSKVDITRELAWKDNKFSFDNKPFTQIMAELSRWYNIEVLYEGKIPEPEFFGGIYRSNTLSTVMALLEANGIRYRLEGRKMIIMQAKKGGEKP
ncbi:FecR family protein [bacterium A37T11]|nr:FecR family protein [bacterium A37T11]